MIGYLFFLLVAVSPKPIIGILTQDYDERSTYIAASYVKYLEMSGAQVIPLFYSLSQQQFTKTLSQINGAFIPGGSQIIDIDNRLTQNANRIVQYSIEQYHKGILFPVWGTCAGHGMLGYLTSNFSKNTRQPIENALGIMNSLKVVNQTATMFKSIPSRILESLSSKPGIAYFYQHWAIYTDTYRQDPLLNNFWQIVTTSVSPAGKEYITAWQAKQYPIFSVQFHPEKSNFQWQIEANRTQDAMELAQYLSNNFVEIARGNPNSFADQRHLFGSLIYNYDTVQPDSKDEDYNMFTQLYIFSQPVI